MILAGTGHRPNKLGGYGEAVTARLRKVARYGLERHKPSQVISGMALGWDMALAEAALDLGFPLTAAVPFAGQERMWPEASQQRYNGILARAAVVHTVSPGGYANWKMQRRNEWMVDRATVLLALWDGSSGGTGNCIKYALTRPCTIDNLWPDWHSLVHSAN